MTGQLDYLASLCLGVTVLDQLAGRSGGRKRSPRQLGRKGYPVQCEAPGTYVHDH